MSPPNSKPTMSPPDSGVTVRLYNPGFGDCLLLAFRAEDGSARYLLIDCGVHHQYPDRQKIVKVARSIAEATGYHLHVVVATHEHTDHLSGFEYAREVFDDIDIDHLWLAWTEDPTDPHAIQLKQLYATRLRALNAAIALAYQAGDPLAEALQGVLDFEYAGQESGPLAYLRTRSKKKLEKPEDYRRPGEDPITLPGVPGVKVYILGPPKDVKWIRMLEKKSEQYPELMAMDELDAFSTAALKVEGTDFDENRENQLFRRSCPFDKSLEISPKDAEKHPVYGKFFRAGYGFSDDRNHGPAWRRIDSAWLAAAEELALDINKKTNNTSLVLAIELTETQPRKVLLFAADAQVGNWLSWQELSWPGEGPNGDPMTIKDLLGRTVCYKVGHHGSRNATLSKDGLELMGSADLVALIPVDQDWAKAEMGWEHPAEQLLKQLLKKARGRVLRSDKIPLPGEQPPQPLEATETLWQAFITGLEWDRSPERLWIQYTVPG